MTVDDKFVRYRWRLAVRLFCEPVTDSAGVVMDRTIGGVAYECDVSCETVEECLRKKLRLQAKGGMR